jgi:hypothetical protein
MEEMYERVKGLENKILRNMKDKEEVMEYLEYRVVGVENSQKNMSDLVKKLLEQDNKKFSQFPILE